MEKWQRHDILQRCTTCPFYLGSVRRRPIILFILLSAMGDNVNAEL